MYNPPLSLLHLGVSLRVFLLLLLPDDVEDGRDQQLVVDGRGHVTRLVESRGHGADGVAQVHPPQQEEELRWGTQEVRQVNGCLLMFLGCWRPRSRK